MSLVVGIIVIPLVFDRADLARGPAAPESAQFLFTWLYWPVVTFMAVASLTTLYHVSTPRRTPWLGTCPGPCSRCSSGRWPPFVLRGTIAASLGGTSIYGPLSTPIVLLIWLYFLAIAILIGAALNAAIRILWHVEERPSARARAVSWARDRISAGGDGDESGAAQARVARPLPARGLARLPARPRARPLPVR